MPDPSTTHRIYDVMDSRTGMRLDRIFIPLGGPPPKPRENENVVCVGTVTTEMSRDLSEWLAGQRDA